MKAKGENRLIDYEGVRSGDVMRRCRKEGRGKSVKADSLPPPEGDNIVTGVVLKANYRLWRYR